MSRGIWKMPDRWRSPGFGARSLLYPALYLRASGTRTLIRRNLGPRDLEDADALVLITDGRLTQADRELLHRCSDRRAAVLVAQLQSLSPDDQRQIELGGAASICLGDDGPLSSAAPGSSTAGAFALVGGAVRSAEDRLLFADLRIEEGSPTPIGAGRHVVVAIQDPAALTELAPALRRHAGRSGLQIVVVASSAAALTADQLPIDNCLVMDHQSPRLLDVVRSAEVLMCAFPAAHVLSPVPGCWVRTALFHGVPVVAGSHASIDGLAHLCVLDDWDRGLALYTRFAGERVKAALKGQTFLAPRLRPANIVDSWRKLLEKVTRAKTSPTVSSRDEAKPVLLVLFDLSQDIDILLPVLVALRARAEVTLRLVASDWLREESPRTFQSLAAQGFETEIHDRALIRRGELPDLSGVAAVLSGSETTAGPHRAGHRLAQRANALGLASFTVQHGFENIGLTYQDETYGAEVRFASDKVFTWCRERSLPKWVATETRAKIVALGSPKQTPSPGAVLRVSGRTWRRTVGVFENLHWDRFDETYRGRFLADLAAAAAADPEVLFLIKPHHAGRWLARNPDALGQTDNLKILDPADPAWQPYTAPVLINSMDAIVTTPSTVSIDAARAGRPVAVAGYDLELGLYSSLPILRSFSDWTAFLSDSTESYVLRNEAFLERALLPGRADSRIAAWIERSVPRTQAGLTGTA